MNKPTHRRRSGRQITVASLSIALVLLAGCASKEQAAQTGAGAGQIKLPDNLVQAAVTKAKEVAGGKLSGTLNVTNDNGGREGAILQAMYAPFTTATGVKINYPGSQDAANLVQARVQAGNPPDVVGIQPGILPQHVKAGKVMNLSEVIGTTRSRRTSPSRCSKASAPTARSTPSPKASATSCSGTTRPPTTGPRRARPGRRSRTGPPRRPRPARHPGASPRKPAAAAASPAHSSSRSWTMFGKLATAKGASNGGVTGALSDSIATGYSGLATDPPKCRAAVWGSWTAGLVNAAAPGGVKPGENLDFFQVPASNPKYLGTEIWQAEAVSALVDSPATRAFMKYIASKEAQTLLASADQWTVANTNVPSSTYASPLLKKAADTYIRGSVELSSGPNVLAPASVGTAFYKGVIAYLKDPGKLDSILKAIDAARQSS